MFIEDSIHNKCIVTLNLGCFPKGVDKFVESQNLFERLIYIDYHLHKILRNQIDGKELGNITTLNVNGVEIQEKIDELLNLREYLAINEKVVTYTEKLYEAVIFAHLYYLKSDFISMKAVLETISVPLEKKSMNLSITESNFLDALACRYYTFFGLLDQESNIKWESYLSNLSKVFTKSNVLGNKWLENLYSNLASSIAKSGKVSFTKFSSLKFFENKLAAIKFGGFLCGSENQNLVHSKFKSEYSTFLKNEISNKMTTKGVFPDAKSTTDEFDDFIENLCETVNKNSLLEISSYRKFLIHSLSTTYQSEVVLANYIKVLIKNNELDEAFGALKTYITYLKKDQEQKNGEIHNILSIIDVYSYCILNFNPLNSILPHSGNKGKFKCTSNDMILKVLSQYVVELEGYLINLSKLADINYEIDKLSDTPLSFLYKRYNPNLVEADNSYLVELISRAWSSLGFYYYYKSTYESHDFEILTNHSTKTLSYYKNALIINTTGNVNYLFNYAIILAYQNRVQSALRLCKFILKKFSNSFKTWNLMALLLTSLENGEHGNNKSKRTRSIKDTSYLSSELNGNRSESLTESEKTIENALNIAGIFMNKYAEANDEDSLATKYDILQLKLTQLAIWEQIYGIQYILDYIPEVFLLYFELFNMQIDPKKSDPLIKNDAKWSHRPSFIDPSITENNINQKRHPKSFSKDLHAAKEKIANISKSSKTNKDLSIKNHCKSEESDFMKRKILQDIWLWASMIYMKIDLLEEAEQCIVEAESLLVPNFKSFTALGLLTSKNRKLLALQEFERSLESLSNERVYNTKDYGTTLLGLAKLFIVDETEKDSLFISKKDMNAGLIRVKNYLEKYSLCWPYGYNSSETWWFLSKVYEILDDKPLLNKSLWRCVELEDFRPARYYDCCDSFNH